MKNFKWLQVIILTASFIFVLIGTSNSAFASTSSITPRIKYANVIDRYTLTETCNPHCFTVSKTNYSYKDLAYVNGYSVSGESRTILENYGYTSVYRVTVNYKTY